jgi:hypothetical protein
MLNFQSWTFKVAIIISKRLWREVVGWLSTVLPYCVINSKPHWESFSDELLDIYRAGLYCTVVYFSKVCNVPYCMCCIVQYVMCCLYVLHCTLYLKYSLHSTLYSVLYWMYSTTVHSMFYNVQYSTVYSAPCILYCTVCAMLLYVCAVCVALRSMFCILQDVLYCTECNVLYGMYCTCFAHWEEGWDAS